MRTLPLLASLINTMGLTHAQVLAPILPNGGAGQLGLATQRVVPYPYIREADVMWQKRVWRDLDVTEKINLPLFYPLEPTDGRSSLFDVIMQALLRDGSVTAFDAGVDGWEDEFSKVLSAERIREVLFNEEETVRETLDGSLETITTTTETKSDDIRRYRLKEDWIFDKQRSCMDIRIIGIAPMKANRGDDGEIRGYEPLFWLYFPELRYVLANKAAFNSWNDGEQRSFDHLFRARMFSSVVVKASNVYDRNIAEYKTGIDGVLESERVKRELFEFEHGLWHY
jgi:gliding motility associated protien GldN